MLESLLSGSLIQTSLLGLIVGLLVYWFIKGRKYNFPPGPLRLPLLGNTFQLGSNERYHLKFQEWSKTYGPVITVGLGPIKLVVVNNLETAMEVLVKKSTDFAGRMVAPSNPILSTVLKLHGIHGNFNRTPFNVGEYSIEVEHVLMISRFTDGYKDIAFTQYGTTWKLHRKLSSKALRQYMQGSALEVRIHKALSTTSAVLEKQEEAFDPKDVVDFLVLNILVGLCFHGDFEFGDKELKHILELDDKFTSQFNNFIPEDFIPGLQYIYTSSAMKEIDTVYRALYNDFLGKKFQEAKRTFNKDNIRHFTDSLLLAREEGEVEDGQTPDSLTDVYLIQTLADIFFAGFDTPRFTLHFAILHMIAFPDIQKKCQEEIDREIGKDRLPGVSDRPNLGYTEAALHESLRMSTVAPSGLFHSTLNDTELAGYKLPKGTLVMINHWALHHDQEAWPEVNKFKPERYLDDNGRLGSKPPNWLPFSAGKRVCLGEFVAKPELHLLFAGLLQQFTWSAEPGVNVDITPQGNLFAGIPAPFKVIVKRRT